MYVFLETETPLDLKQQRWAVNVNIINSFMLICPCTSVSDPHVLQIVITHPCPKFNGGLVKPPLKLLHPT